MPLSWLPAHLQTQPSREGKECTWLAQRHTEWSGKSVEMVAADPDTDHPGAVRRSDVKRGIADHDSLLRVSLLAARPPASISVPSMSDTTRMRSDIAPPHPESPGGWHRTPRATDAARIQRAPGAVKASTRGPNASTLVAFRQ